MSDASIPSSSHRGTRTAIQSRRYVLAHRRKGLPGNDPRPDGCLDRDLEELTRKDLPCSESDTRALEEWRNESRLHLRSFLVHARPTCCATLLCTIIASASTGFPLSIMLSYPDEPSNPAREWIQTPFQLTLTRSDCSYPASS
jgi:hypothetical protein